MRNIGDRLEQDCHNIFTVSLDMIHKRLNPALYGCGMYVISVSKGYGLKSNKT